MLKRSHFKTISRIFLILWGVAMPATASSMQLYKVVSVKNWEQSQSQDRLLLSSMDKEFVHLSTKDQLDRIIEKFWKNESAFFVLTLDANKLQGRLVFEANPGGSNKYYHLYDGFIPMSAIISVSKILR